ncbi:putative calmodulin-binding protein sha1 protein [Lasiodiplodia theobromae]|uniref:Abnormal spindle-like microcephaly-associated protein-like protein n=1 Tax=Lasiodiplodia theobromae TaxID=45133 RepID=A0A5N5CYN3_9PEZI|nr:Calmodulin-binding protein sha1 [Lasiodiplodia theobromae]KAB2570392.1 Abnormal spindle-like microcephaly-associated protein-like protein [Lasiodiplodia theobromae]KAF4543037.1 Calmodulin-binding protein sha1 [Lasiodiplodia theobromae]KAF9635610.1 putative calmodulin-binding protein sha1 protein [Lasiodiplodia theobromae]
MRRCTETTPCPAPFGRCSAGPHIDSTTNPNYTADLGQTLHLFNPRRRPAKPSRASSVDIWVDDDAELLPLPTGPMPPAQRPKAPQKTSIPPDLPPAGGSLRPRRRRVSALLAERGLAAAERHATDKTSSKSDPRRRTVDVPSDDTNIHPGYPRHSRRPPSPDLGFDLVTLSEEEPHGLPPAIKQAKTLATAPKRGPLQKSSRPLQAVSFVEDVVGKSLGKENIPPGRGLKTAKQLRPVTDAPGKPKNPEPVRRHFAAKTAATRKRTGSDSVSSPSKALRTTTSTTYARPPLQEPIKGRQTRSSTSKPSSPFHASRSPPQVLRRNRAAKPPSKLGAPRLPQGVQSQDKYPVLSEDLDRPELYEDNWLSYQEVSITQLVNKVFDYGHLPSAGQNLEEGELRRSLLAVYQDPAIPLLHKRLQASLMCGALSIPKDVLVKTLRLKDDVGLRRKYLNLFVNTYEPSLLRAAAEVIVGRECRVPTRPSARATAASGDQRHRRTEKKVIEGFLDTFFIRNEDAVRVKTGFGSIASIARGRDKADDFGSQDWSWRRITLRSLMLILLLDMAKAKGVIGYPLFQVLSSFKSSHAVLQELASMLVPSLGDLSRPLAHLNYHLHYVQYPLQEYNYRVENLATDLRDGVLLTRLVELLLYPPTSLALHQEVTITMPTGDILTSCLKDDKELLVLSQHLKFPCVGRAQKQYNVQIALSALEGTTGVAEHALRDVSAEDIVDGHREKTLGLLWSLVGKWGLDTLVDWTELEKETQRYRSRYHSNVPNVYQDQDTAEESGPIELRGLERYMALLRGWADGIARCRGLRATNLTTSFADGRVLEAIVDEYIACFSNATGHFINGLPAKLQLIGCSTAFVSLFAPASKTFNRSIPSKDFTVTTLAFLASRLLPAGRAHHAASTLQRWYRARLLRREMSKRVTLMRLAAHCATVVQTRERVVGAAVVLQRAWRTVLDARIRKLVDDVTRFQALARGWGVRNRMPNGTKTRSRRMRKTDRIRGGW